MLTQPPLSVRRAILTTLDPTCFVHVCSVLESESVGELLKVLPSLFRTTAYIENQIPLILINLETLETKWFENICFDYAQYLEIRTCMSMQHPFESTEEDFWHVIGMVDVI